MEADDEEVTTIDAEKGLTTKKPIAIKKSKMAGPKKLAEQDDAIKLGDDGEINVREAKEDGSGALIKLKPTGMEVGKEKKREVGAPKGEKPQFEEMEVAILSKDADTAEVQADKAAVKATKAALDETRTLKTAAAVKVDTATKAKKDAELEKTSAVSKEKVHDPRSPAPVTPARHYTVGVTAHPRSDSPPPHH